MFYYEYQSPINQRAYRTGNDQFSVYRSCCKHIIQSTPYFTCHCKYWLYLWGDNNKCSWDPTWWFFHPKCGHYRTPTTVTINFSPQPYDTKKKIVLNLTINKANSYTVGSVDRKRRLPVGDQIGDSYVFEKVPFRSRFFRSSSPNRASRRKVDLFNGMHRSDCSIERLVEAHRISSHSTKHTIASFNSSMLAWRYHTAWCSLRRGVAPPVVRSPEARTSSDGSSVRYRLPLCNTADPAELLLSRAIIGDSRRSPTPLAQR